MKRKKRFRRLVLVLGLLSALFIVAAAVAVLSGVSIRLDFLRPAIEKGATEALGRPVSIEGSIELTPGLRPVVRVGNVTIRNPKDWAEDRFAFLSMARTQIDLPDLFARDISIGEVAADGVMLNLVSDAQGRNNWDIGPANDYQKQAQDAPGPKSQNTLAEPEPNERKFRFHALDHLSLTNISVHYRDEVMDKTVDFRLEDFSGSAKSGEPVLFSIAGSIQGHPFTFRVDGGSLTDLRDKGRSWPLKISGNLADTHIDATGKLEREGREPRLHLGLSLGRVDIGAILARLKIIQGLQTSTRRLFLETILVGDSLHDLVARSRLTIRLEGGQLTLQDPNTGTSLPLTIVNGQIGILPGNPVEIDINGKIDNTPVELKISGTSLADLLTRSDDASVRLEAEAAGATLTLEGRLGLPVNARDASLAMTFRGENLDTLEELLPVDLPPFGPYALRARFVVVESGYELSDLLVKVGESELAGTLRLDTSGAKPLTEVALTSKRLQLDDFSIAGWSPEPGRKLAQGSVPPPNSRRGERIQEVKGLFSPEVLNAFDATFRMDVDQVLSGKDRLGGGKLGVRVEKGTFSADPLRLDIPGGSVRISFAYHPAEKENTVHLGMHIEQFDVGILVHRVAPDRNFGGLLSLDVELEGTAPDVRHLLANTSGHIDFVFWPENMDAGIVDLWAVNLLTVLTEQVDNAPNSVLNCMVARFRLEEGQMQEEAIFMDTTRMSVSADADIDFKAETIDVLAAPEAKRPEYFSLATPVKIKGSFSDFGIHVNKLSVAKTAVSFITSPITVTFKRLFSGNVPADGKAACQRAWEGDQQE